MAESVFTNFPGLVISSSSISNNNYNGYIKFTNGIMIAWKRVDINTTITGGPWGGQTLYYSAAQSLGNWPASFS